MSLIPRVKCYRCGAEFSSLRNRCPECGVRRVSQSSRVPSTSQSTVPGTAAHERLVSNTKWQMLFGMVLVVAVILSVIVMVSMSLEAQDSSIVRATATPTLPVNEAPPTMEAPPTAEPTIPQVESVTIWYYTNNYTGKDFTMHPGDEAVPLTASVIPITIENAPIEWSCSDETGEVMQLIPDENGGIKCNCVGTIPGGVRVTATCYGVSATVTIYCVEN